jgi:hypothetical protein
VWSILDKPIEGILKMKKMLGRFLAFSIAAIFLCGSCFAGEKSNASFGDKERLKIFDKIWQICAVQNHQLGQYSSPEVIKVTKQMKYGQPDGTEIVRVKATAVMNGAESTAKFEIKMKSDFSAYRKAMYSLTHDAWVGETGRIDGCHRNYFTSFANSYEGPHDKEGWVPR